MEGVVSSPSLSDVLANAKARWHASYSKYPPSYVPPFTNGKALAQFADLLDATTTPDEFDALIGNVSWTQERCAICGKDTREWLRVGEEPDYESQTIWLCLDCAERIGDIAKAMKGSRR